MTEVRLFLADSRPRYDLSWAIRKPGYGSFAEALSFAAKSCLIDKRRRYIHELVTKPKGWLWWRHLHTEWVPRYYVEPSDNTVRSLERWGIVDVPMASKVSDPDGYTALEDGRVVVVRRMVRR